MSTEQCTSEWSIETTWEWYEFIVNLGKFDGVVVNDGKYNEIIALDDGA